MTRIKICGIRREEDIMFVNEALPEYIGFVFAEGRRRYISPDKAQELRKLLDSRIKTVGVFVDGNEEIIADTARRGITDIIQLHGSEDAEYISRIKKSCGLPVIKAFTVRNAGDIRAALTSTADMILLDNGCGTGEVFEHGLLEGFGREYFLAGGLSCDNIADIIKKYSPSCVDVSSGVETDGFKDGEKIKRFVSTVRKGR